MFGRSDPSIRLELERQVGEVGYNDTGKPLRAAELEALIPGFDGYIAGLDEVTAEVLAAGGQLKVIARYGVGVDQVDLVAARDRGIVVTNTPGANSKAVAELAVGLMLALARSIPQASQDTKAGGCRASQVSPWKAGPSGCTASGLRLHRPCP
jgi:D-3-phosphoglycerate dehydrogenase